MSEWQEVRCNAIELVAGELVLLAARLLKAAGERERPARLLYEFAAPAAQQKMRRKALERLSDKMHGRKCDAEDTHSVRAE